MKRRDKMRFKRFLNVTHIKNNHIDIGKQAVDTRVQAVK